jgi:hypothetical protein
MIRFYIFFLRRKESFAIYFSGRINPPSQTYFPSRTATEKVKQTKLAHKLLRILDSREIQRQQKKINSHRFPFRWHGVFILEWQFRPPASQNHTSPQMTRSPITVMSQPASQSSSSFQRWRLYTQFSVSLLLMNKNLFNFLIIRGGWQRKAKEMYRKLPENRKSFQKR